MKFLKVFSIMLALGMTLSMVNAEEETSCENCEKDCFVMQAGRFALLYVPNVVCDLLDIVTMQVVAGNTAAAEVYATRMADFGFEFSDCYYAGWSPRHSFNAGHREVDHFALLCWSYDDIYVSQVCGEYSYSLKDAQFNFMSFNSDVYEDKNINVLAIGARAAFIAGLAVDVNLQAIPDFLCSLVGVDLSGDNWK